MDVQETGSVSGDVFLFRLLRTDCLLFLSRLLHDDHLRPTTMDYSTSRIRMSHALGVEIRYKKIGSQGEQRVQLLQSLQVASVSLFFVSFWYHGSHYFLQCCTSRDSLQLPSFVSFPIIQSNKLNPSSPLGTPKILNRTLNPYQENITAFVIFRSRNYIKKRTRRSSKYRRRLKSHLLPTFNPNPRPSGVSWGFIVRKPGEGEVECEEVLSGRDSYGVVVFKICVCVFMRSSVSLTVNVCTLALGGSNGAKYRLQYRRDFLGEWVRPTARRWIRKTATTRGYGADGLTVNSPTSCQYREVANQPYLPSGDTGQPYLPRSRLPTATRKDKLKDLRILFPPRSLLLSLSLWSTVWPTGQH